jgi:ribosomal protein S19E (S16A)
MASRRNPLQLNALQLKTLTLLQQLARLPAFSRPAGEAGEIAIAALPQLHGDHLHLGDAVVASRDASGLSNPAVWAALERKGLVRSLAGEGAVLTRLGRDYPTGLGPAILRKPAD